MSAVNRVFPMVLGNTMKSDKVLMEHLKYKVNLKEVHTPDDCNVIIAFVAIVSRAGTDIQAALQRIPKHEHKRIILVSLHHTFDTHYIPPDSRYCINRDDVFAVDCLYHEDHGLLNSPCNDESLKRITDYLRKQHFEESSRSVCDCVDLIGWVLTVLSLTCVYLVQAGFINIVIIIAEPVLLTIIAVYSNSPAYRNYSIWICSGTNVIFILYILNY